MTSTWYGRNYDSSLGDPPTQFCGVENFCSYVTSNTGDGPKAIVYNNGKVYTKLTKKFKKGDVLQFYNDLKGRYSHSVIVVSTTDYAVSDYTKVRVAAHDSDYSDRPLSKYIKSSDCKMRLLRFQPTTFAD